MFDEFDVLCANAICPEDQISTWPNPFIKVLISGTDSRTISCVGPDLFRSYLALDYGIPENTYAFIDSFNILSRLKSYGFHDYIKIRKFGTGFRLYPAGETDDSKFRICTLIVDNQIGQSNSFDCLVYDPNYGYLTIRAPHRCGKEMVNPISINNPSDIFGVSLEGVDSVVSLVKVLHSELGGKEYKVHIESIAWSYDGLYINYDPSPGSPCLGSKDATSVEEVEEKLLRKVRKVGEPLVVVSLAKQ